MSSYERRIVHTELSQRTDVITDSQGDGRDRHIVIKPR
jgi:spoIIIJ-associated protein